MTKQEKIAAIGAAMTTSKRAYEPHDAFYHFTYSAPRELIELYLKHWEVRDLDYETFSRACDIVSEIYAEKPEITQDDATDDIYERASDSANVYNDVRLGYLTIWNQDEIGDYVRDLHCDVATAAAYWYDKQVEQQAIIINDWINA